MKIQKFLLLALLLLTSCEGFQDKDPALFSAPEVTAGKAVVSDASIAVELSGAISAIDCKAVKECGFYVSKDAALANKTTVAATVEEQFSANFSSEEFGTKFFYQAFISNGKYVITSETQSFEIKPFEYYVSVGKPELVGTELTIAKFKASVQWAEGLNLDETGLQYSRNEDFSSTSEASQTTGLDTITQDIELDPGVEYHIRVYAKKGSNVEYGEAITVTVYSLPEVRTSSTVIDVTPTSATCGGEVTSDGGAQVTEYGVVYGTSQNPTIETATKKAVGKGTGSFSATLTGLTTGSTYYVRAYATNSQGTAYGEEVSFTTAKSVTGISLDKTSISLEKGASQTLIATITPSDAYDKAVTWSTSNSSIATVTDGKVTAIAPGTATITATTRDGSHKVTCAVTVISRVTGVSLNKTSLTLTQGASETLIATITPSDATNKAVTWSSSNTSVATVSSTGVVTAKAVGSATITVTTSDGGKKAICAVTVKAKTISVTGVSLDKTSLSMTVGDTQTLTATITPSNATNKSVTWSSSNTSVATVSTAGVVTAKATGSTIITVTTQDGGYKAYCSVTVKGTTPDTGRYISFETTSGENQIYYNSFHCFDYTVSLEYSYDKINWDIWEKNKRLSFSNTSVLYIRGNNPNGLSKQTLSNGRYYGLFGFSSAAKVICKGNIMNLLSYTHNSQLSSHCFEYLFCNCSCLIEAPDLPATTLAEYCYRGMFANCESLQSAPLLPATSLEQGCYCYMFSDCKSLTNAPLLPATTLAPSCYYGMFSNCTSLPSAPKLPATTLKYGCYYNMFKGCSKLSYVEALFTNTATYAIDEWLSGVNPTGTFVKNRNATWANDGVVPTGWTIEYADE